MAGLTRDEVHEIIEGAGGKASGSVAAKTDYLICGESGSSKHVKAQSLGVPILTPDEFATLLVAPRG